MNIPIFRVRKTGLYTTIQDNGRFGFQKYGVVTSGVMDSFSAELANIVVGNPRSFATIEITIVGPELEVLNPCTVAFCGADLSVTKNGNPIDLWSAIIMKKGDIIQFSKPNAGSRLYMAIAGGIQAENVLGSMSVYEKAGFGQVVKNDQIIYGRKHLPVTYIKRLPKQFIPTFHTHETIRVVLGPHESRFTESGIHTFLTTHYTIKMADRMGYRLQSNKNISHVNGADIYSEAIPIGSIQVPASGQPIVLLADRQTTGGYTRIATVATVDLGKLTQMPVGGIIRFKVISIYESQRLLRKRERQLRIWDLLNTNNITASS
ncbi:biotin-dependent carboxyltransferase [Bacillus sp. HMF5848]|uniref:5-oxoprolinase subunit C family protein n=1 Tax=Bacillus sp. HMF5848 TaxID=2495421 RepID=UPI000F789851|nr:biotin-dependent carboxyltransferase family protein [Bacillus sp. HMF5848]RSK26759.1 biotin-dependent carboxyltransferase [Bacillus sp. HMF5848]